MLTSTTSGMNVGQNAGSSGTLEVLDGGSYHVSTHGIGVGVSAGATGTILVDGSGSQINVLAQSGTFGVAIGQGGTGYLTVQNGGSVGSGIAIIVGAAAGATGTVAVTGGGLLTTSGTAGINVGAPGSGLLTIGVGLETLGVGDTVSAAGTVIAANFFDIATGSTASTGTVVVNGGTLDDHGIFNVANTGTGTLVVEGGGLVDQTGINFNIGSSSGSHGTVEVNGGTLVTNGSLDIGASGASGLLTVSSGTVTATDVNVGTGGTVTVGGGTAAALFSDSGQFDLGNTGTTALLSIGSLGVVTGTSGDALQIGGFGTSAGTVTIGNGGTLDGFGGFLIDNGLMTVAAGDQVTVSSTSTLVGSGIGSGPSGSGTLIVNGGTVSATNAAFNIGDNSASGSLLVEAGGLLTTTTIASQFAQISIDGSSTSTAVATIHGGTWDAYGPLAIASGANNTGSLAVSGSGTVSGVVNAGTNAISIATQSGASGTVSVGSGGTLLGGGLALSNPFTGSATGLLTVAGGGTVELGGLLQEGAGGTITVGGGTAEALLASSGGILIGASGSTAVMTVGSLGVVSAGTADTLQIGTGFNGTVTVGNGGTLDRTGALDVDDGILTVNSGAQAIFSSTTLASNIGALSGGSGTLIVNGGTVSATNAFFDIGGSNASGSLLDEGGGLLTTTSTGNGPAGEINASGTGVAAATVSDATWTLNGALNVGDSGTGALDINSTGVVNAGTNAIDIGNQSSGTGDVTVEHFGTLIGGPLNIADPYNGGGNGTLTVSNGSSVEVSSVSVGGGGTIALAGGTAYAVLTSSGMIAIGQSGTGGLLNIGNNAVVTGNSGSALQIAVATGSSGTVTVASGGTLDGIGGLTVGNQGNGLLTVASGGTVTADSTTQSSNIGFGQGGSGTLIVNGGTVSDTAAFFTVGGNGGGGAGTLLVEGGGLLTTTSDGNTAGQIDGAAGDAIATVNDGTWDVNGFLIVGNNSGNSGTLDITNGLVNAGSNAITIGNLPGSNGTVSVGSGGTLIGGGLTMADQTGSSGTLTVASGGTVDLGSIADGGGAIDVTGGLLSVSGLTTIGQSEGGATLTLQSGTVDTAGLYIGNDTGATGTVTVSGGVLDSTGQVQIGNQGDGLLEVDTGGSVDATGGLQVDSFGTGNGTVIVDGGSLTDSNGFNIGNGGSTGVAGVTVEAGGLLSASGNNQFDIGSGGGTAEVVVSGGTFSSSGSSLEIGGSGGSGGSASLLVENAGTVVTTFGGVGPAADINAGGGAQASVTVTGTGSVWDIDAATGDQLAVGDSGSGSLTVSDGAVVNTGSNAIVIGNQNSGTGYVDVNTGNALLEGASVSVGSGTSSGTLEIDTGGTVDVVSASVGQDGSLILGGGLLDPIALTLSAGGVISGFGTLDANLDNASTVTASGGALEVTGTVTDFGTMAITTSATLVLPGTVGAGQIIDFTANIGVLQVGTIGFNGTIDGIQSGDTIILSGVTDATAANLVGTNTLQIVSVSLGDIDLQLDPEQGFGGDYFHVNTVGGNAVVTENNVPCYLAGTRILTDRGEVPVETLRIGDCVVTLDGSAKPIKWIGRRSYSGAIPTGLRDVIPILIRQGALGENLPARDLIVSPLHAMYCDGVLVPAEHLVNGISILRAPDIDPIRYFHVELEQHDVIYADGAAAETFVDCDSRAMFHNAAEFDSLYPGDATPRWQYCAPRVEGGERLAAIKRAIDRRAGIELPEPGAPPGRLEGRLDGIEGGRISGWAFHPDRPEAQVWLEVLDGDGVIARVHARRYRADLESAGIGDGRHGFELHLTGQMRTRREIRVRRVEDGVELDGSPLVVEARGGEALLEDARRVIAAAILDPSDEAALDALAAELLHGVDALRQARAARGAIARSTQLPGSASSLPPQVIARSEATKQSPAEDCFGPAGLAMTKGTAGGATVAPRAHGGRLRRALIIDAQLPRPEHDAGSQAILSHAAALTSLGFQVEFVAAHELARADQASVALEHAGYVVHRAPHVASVEEVLRRHRNAFDVVYLHRLANAEAYAPLARAWQARARLLYCVADLHHVRLARQAAVQASAELADEARAVRVRELNAMRLCDAVITHSTAEAAYLARVAPGASVHVVAWTPLARPRPVPLAARRGVAAIGSWSHEPNVDAVRWLVSDIMPRVWAAAPRIELLVVGSDWPARVPWIADARVRLVGAVTSIETLLGMLRATVAPLRFGAGLKGKVLDSFACEVPCVMTPIAAEGFPLEGTLPGLVAEDAATLAGLIVRLHEESPFHRAAAGDGLALAARFSPESVRAAMAVAIGMREAGAQALGVAAAAVAQ
ncbi:MAG: Hint domain-containing protein [Acetobacteraceae bacterium]